MTSRPSLTHTEAQARAAQLDVTSYDVTLDLAGDPETFRSVTRITFASTGGPTFCEVDPVRLHEMRFNDAALSEEALVNGRIRLDTLAGDNHLTVDATMRFRTDGEGLHHHTDPADGRRYVYGMSFMDAAPSVFACFDQPDLKAPYTFHVTAPVDWTVIGNAAGEQVEPGRWEFEASAPLSTYFVTLVAGPYHLISDHHDGIPLGLSARASLASALEAEADELLTLTRQCFDEFHRLFGIRYPFGKYHQAFVPDFNAGAMENPGCVTFRDQMIYTSAVTRGTRIKRATTVAHEMAHQWFGNLTTPRWWDDLWLNESFAEYLGNRVTADVTEYGDAWTHHAWARRQWGLVTDQRPTTHPVAGNGATDARLALQDFDGISYVKGSSILKQLNTRLGDDVFLAGVVDHFERATFGNATMADLVGCWQRAADRAGTRIDLAAFTDHWLRRAGADTLSVDRAGPTLLRSQPDGLPADRAHTLRLAVATPPATPPVTWEVREVSTEGDRTALLDIPADAAVVVDCFEDTWAVTLLDDRTRRTLPTLLAGTTDPRVRAGIWNSVRSAAHNAAVTPAELRALLIAGIPREDDDGLGTLVPWACEVVAPLLDDRRSLFDDLAGACAARVESAAPRSSTRLAAFQGQIRCTTDPLVLRGWLQGSVPEGLILDTDLRWRVLHRLAALGDTDVTELTEHLDAEPTTVARIEFGRCRAALPAADAKAWAWSHLTGERTAANHQVTAIGAGFWNADQSEFTDAYLTRYFSDVRRLHEHYEGWMLPDVAAAFFPLGHLDSATLAATEELLDAHVLEPSVQRRLTDLADELRRRRRLRLLGSR
ncbi:aminopeptidase N [Nocardioides limicola]|uniref:aminopeptidase N n=1 Tax=Nocardioides limicola TaxID=2803368 RepID=UPI00193C2077|nr:aminopeptidase N [Nocardioides sp. DJM-14]